MQGFVRFCARSLCMLDLVSIHNLRTAFSFSSSSRHPGLLLHLLVAATPLWDKVAIAASQHLCPVPASALGIRRTNTERSVLARKASQVHKTARKCTTFDLLGGKLDAALQVYAIQGQQR